MKTAIVFSANQIDLVNVDPDSKQLIAAYSQTLPAGCIARGQIIKSDLVSQSLSVLLKQSPKPITEAIVIIPEDAVISKSIDLPKINRNEINEAVSWEAESFLPFSPEEAVIDWQTLKEGEQIHVLFQAIKQDIVDTYIKIIDNFKIEISAIETPAMTMVQLAETKPGIRVLVHVSPYDAVLTLAKDKEVVATSVITNMVNLSSSVKETIQHMIAYYQDFPVAWIQIGGMGVGSAMIKALTSLKLPIGGFNLPITAKPALANNYLLGIAAAAKAVFPPSDQSSINLLPDWYIDNKQSHYFTSFLRKSLIASTIFFGSALLGLGIIFSWISKQNQLLLDKQNQPPTISQKNLREAGTTNTLAGLVIKLSVSDQFPTQLIRNIQNQQGDKIKIAAINLSLIDKKGEITALANNRNAMLEFKSKIDQLPETGLVQLPASTLAEEADIPFKLFFNLVEISATKK